jgi:hypothetical protein
MRDETTYMTSMPKRIPMTRSRATTRSNAGPASWTTHKRYANAIWKPA